MSLRLRLCLIFAYLPFVSLVSALYLLLCYPHERVLMDHARQGFVLFGVWFLLLFVPSFSPLLGLLLWLVLFCLGVRAAYKAVHGHLYAIPVVSHFVGFVPLDFIYYHLTGRHMSADH